MLSKLATPSSQVSACDSLSPTTASITSGDCHAAMLPWLPLRPRDALLESFGGRDAALTTATDAYESDTQASSITSGSVGSVAEPDPKRCNRAAADSTCARVPGAAGPDPHRAMATQVSCALADTFASCLQRGSSASKVLDGLDNHASWYQNGTMAAKMSSPGSLHSLINTNKYCKLLRQYYGCCDLRCELALIRSARQAPPQPIRRQH